MTIWDEFETINLTRRSNVIKSIYEQHQVDTEEYLSKKDKIIAEYKSIMKDREFKKELITTVAVWFTIIATMSITFWLILLFAD